MIIDCLLTDPAGDTPLGPSEKRLPFKTAPGQDHPFLSLGDYFELLKLSMSRDGSNELAGALSICLGRPVVPEEISRLVIRSEKHGALYHVARIEIHVAGGPLLEFALSTAFSEKSRTQATWEFRALRTLAETFDYPYLPRIYLFRDEVVNVRGRPVAFSQFLCDWFQDYHEWHLATGPDGDHRACIWDTRRGRHLADKPDTGEIFRQASMILTLYYDVGTSRRIHPIHHGAGDFVVRTDPQGVEVRLTTARDYAPFFEKPAEIAPQLALFYFFLDLTVRMRLDREEGTGDPIWAGGFSVDSATRGFVDALATKEREGRLEADGTLAFRTLLRSFSRREFETAYAPLLEKYRLTDPAEELSLIERHIPAHAEDLCRVIQALQ